jgi:hypothetical protein
MAMSNQQDSSASEKVAESAEVLEETSVQQTDWSSPSSVDSYGLTGMSPSGAFLSYSIGDR